VITIAQVNDAAKWEAAFRTHVELFRKYSVKNHVDFATNGNEIIVCMEPEDFDLFKSAMSSQANTDAMAFDGVKIETVKTYVLDKVMEL
jgi:hypothetical protein